jgi:catalase
MKGFTSFPEPMGEDKVRGKPEKFAEHYSQATLFYNSQSEVEKAHIIRAFRFELTRVQTAAIRARVVSQLVNVDEGLARAVAEGLGIELPEAQPLAAPRRIKSEVRASEALSLFAGRSLQALHEQLLDQGAVPRFVGARLGQLTTEDGDPIDVEVTIEGAPSVLWDGLVIPDGEAAADVLAADGQALEFVKDQYRHCKTILALGSGANVLETANIPAELPNGESDPGLLRIDSDEAANASAAFATALSQHRHFARQTDPPRV